MDWMVGNYWYGNNNFYVFNFFYELKLYSYFTSKIRGGYLNG